MGLVDDESKEETLSDISEEMDDEMLADEKVYLFRPTNNRQSTVPPRNVKNSSMVRKSWMAPNVSGMHNNNLDVTRQSAASVLPTQYRMDTQTGREGRKSYVGQRMQTEGNHRSGDDHGFHNKFAEQPNKYVYLIPERFKKNIYKGMDFLFWQGFYAPPEVEVVCWIEQGLEHRRNNISLIERAYIKKEDIEAYYNDRIF